MARLKQLWVSSSNWRSSLVLFTYISAITLTQGAYNEQYLDSLGCSSVKKISLANFPNNTLVLKLSRWEDYHLPSAFMNFQCEFQVVAPRGHGIMVITQGLHLRTKSKQSHTCRDYIKFEQNDGRESGPICGEVNVSDNSLSPKGLIGPRTFYDPNGAVDVFFSADESISGEVQKPMFLQLVFTTYSECTTMDLITHKIRSCSEGRGNACIATNLFCDGVINCGFKDDFASDETHCNEPEDKSTKDMPIPPWTENKIRDKTSRTSYLDDEEPDPAEHHFEIASLPIHVFALISAAGGGLLVLLFIFFCCCLGRIGRLSPRNATLRQENPEGTVQIGVVTHPMRMTPSAKLVKPREDLPPPYEAIFPQPQLQPEKK